VYNPKESKIKPAKMHVLFLGSDGFPYGMADVEKQKLIAKGLNLQGVEVSVISRKGVHSKNTGLEIKGEGIFEGINYYYASGTPFRSDNFLKRNLQKIKGVLSEFIIIYKIYTSQKIDAVITSNMSIYRIIYYRILAEIFGFKLILSYMEYVRAISKKTLLNINGKLFDKYVFRFLHAALPISDFLILKIEESRTGLKYLKVPALCDYNIFNDTHRSSEEKYFLFCGDANYSEIIKFIIGSFNRVNNDEFGLILVVSGTMPQMESLHAFINGSGKKDKIKIFSRLKYSDLLILYKNASALLIPLTPTLKDEARFPHKIGEYLASGNPMITTNIGEIKYYFNDRVNALVSQHYDESEYSEKMKYVIDNPEISAGIGEEGRKTGEKFFDYKKEGREIYNFINHLV
jgi:glycosyltransferase involved in cell wall biosynthesis